MEKVRRPYKAPRLIVHGDLEKITRQGGGGYYDVVQGLGDPVVAPGDPGNTTSDPSALH